MVIGPRFPENDDVTIESRVRELEETTRSMVGVVRTMSEMVSNLNSMVNHYSDLFGGMALSLPSVAHKLPLWPVIARTVPGLPDEGNGGASGYCCGACPDGRGDDTTG